MTANLKPEPFPPAAPARVRPAPRPPHPWRYDRKQFNLMAETGVFGPQPHVELLNGEVVAMSPQNSKHGNAITRLNMLLTAAYAGRQAVRVQLPFAVSDHHEPEPDLCVVDGAIPPDADHPSAAVLVIEVADSSLEFDRDVKAKIYAAANVPEYWVVDLNGETVEIYTGPRGGTYATKRTLQGDDVTPLPHAQATIRTAEVFGR
jgi:Uma2 family endonuclease